MLRSAEAAGVHGVVFPTRRQAPLTPSAIKASAGAVEHLLLCPVDDLPGALADLHSRGLRICGAEEDAPLTARQTDLRGPLALVVGSEGQGLGPAVRRRCDTFMRIPMRGAIGSLNAAVAGSIMLFEAVAQRDPHRGRGPAAERLGARDLPEGAAATRIPPPASRIPPPATRILPPASRKPSPPNPPRSRNLRPSRRQNRGQRRPRICCRAAPNRRNHRSPDPLADTPPALDPFGRGALSFPGARRVDCGVTLRVAPT